MLEAFITNLGRYNEGYLDGAYLKLPAEKEDVQALLKKIHVDGVRYEEIFITDYETDVPGGLLLVSFLMMFARETPEQTR